MIHAIILNIFPRFTQDTLYALTISYHQITDPSKSIIALLLQYIEKEQFVV
jgi:hypothetical protein